MDRKASFSHTRELKPAMFGIAALVLVAIFTASFQARAKPILEIVWSSPLLLFLIAIGANPIGGGREGKKSPWFARYGTAFLAVAAATLLRMALTPLIGPTALPFATFFPAVLVAGWFGGFGAVVFSVAISGLAAAYFLQLPVGSFPIHNPVDQIVVLLLAAVGLGVAFMKDRQGRLVAFAQTEDAERAERQRFETTLASIGDAVMATDAQGRVTFANKVALSLLRSEESDVLGRPLDQVFHIVNEQTRATVESPVARVFREGAIVGLGNHTVLIAQDGTEVPIDDSAAPIRGADGANHGAVLVFRDITERRHADRTKQRLASVVESSDDAIITKDLNGIVTTWNRGAEIIFGYSAREAIGQPISIIAAPGRLDEMQGILEQIKRGEKVDHHQTTRRAKNGAVIHISLTVSPVRDAEGRITGASKIARDITAQVKAQAEVAEQRERLQVTLNSIGDAVMATDAEGRVTFANKVALSLLRSSESEVLGRPLDEVFRIVNEYTRAKVESPVAKVLREGTVVGLANHTVLIAQDGTEVPIDDSGAPIRAADGVTLGTVLVFRDITERRQAERAKERLASVVESSEDAIITKSLDGIITSWNSGAERVFGYPAPEAIGQPISIIAAPGRADEMRDILNRIRSGGHIDHYQTLRRTKSGKIIHISLTVSPVVDERGQVTGASKIARDITPQVEAQAELAEQRERLRVTLNSIGDGVLTTDTAGRVSYLNPVAEKLTGWPSAAAIGKPLDEIFQIVNEESRRSVENPVTKALREGQIVGLANHTVLITREGKELSIDDSASPIRDASGDMVGVVLTFRDVTEKRIRDKRYAEQSAELRRTAHLLEPVHCFVRDLDDTIVFWNPGAAELYGYSSSEALGQTSHLLLKTVLPKPLAEIRQQVLITGQWDGELQHTRRNGEKITVLSHWALHRNPHGLPTVILEINSNINERKEAEQQLGIVREQLGLELSGMRALHELASRTFKPGDLQSLLDAILHTAETVTSTHMGNIQLVTENGTLRMAAHDGLGEEFTTFWSEVHDEEGSCGTAMARSERVIVEDVTNSPVFAGPGLQVMLNAGVRSCQSTPMISHSGAFIGMLNTHYGHPGKPSERDLRLLDLLARQSADLIEKLRAEAALQQSEERLAAILQHLPVGVGVVDTAGRVVIGNPAWKRFLRGDIPPVDDQERARWRAVGSDGKPLALAEYPAIRALRGDEVLPGVDFLWKHDDGSERWTRVSAVPLRDATNQIIGALTMLQDIEEERRAEEQRVELIAKERALVTEKALRAAETELARVVRALSVGELATSIAHEINQPLAGVVTNAQAGLRWLGGENPNIPEARESLALVARDGNRASEVIKRIRTFLKKESQQASSLDVNEVVREAIALANAELAKRKVSLRIALSSDLPLVHGDRIQLQQVILNLVMNGADAMISTERPKELLVTSRRSQDGKAVVSVRDNGIGIPAEVKDKMFDTFFTTKSAGMGIGLSISRTIIEAHGGQIWAEFHDGPGLTVEFGLPPEAVPRYR